MLTSMRLSARARARLACLLMMTDPAVSACWVRLMGIKRAPLSRAATQIGEVLSSYLSCLVWLGNQDGTEFGNPSRPGGGNR